MHRSLALFGLALPLALTAPASAQTRPAEATVSLKGLDLNSPADAGLFLQRLDAAAAKVCGPEPDFRDLERGDAYRTCEAETKARTLERLGNAQVSAIAKGAEQETAKIAAKPKI